MRRSISRTYLQAYHRREQSDDASLCSETLHTNPMQQPAVPPTVDPRDPPCFQPTTIHTSPFPLGLPQPSQGCNEPNNSRWRNTAEHQIVFLQRSRDLAYASSYARNRYAKGPSRQEADHNTESCFRQQHGADHVTGAIAATRESRHEGDGRTINYSQPFTFSGSPSSDCSKR